MTGHLDVDTGRCTVSRGPRCPIRRGWFAWGLATIGWGLATILLLVSVALFGVVRSPLLAREAPAPRLDVGDALESLCDDHTGSACATLAMLHERGAGGSAWCCGTQTGVVEGYLNIPRDAAAAETYWRHACMEGYRTQYHDCDPE